VGRLHVGISSLHLVRLRDTYISIAFNNLCETPLRLLPFDSACWSSALERWRCNAVAFHRELLEECF
jgi:hypothetical protein